MYKYFRIASFNVENLFGRAKVFNFKDKREGDVHIKRIAELTKILDNKKYSAKNKKDILKLYKQLQPYIAIREDRGKLFRRSGWKVVGVQAGGSTDWDGSIEFKQARFSEVARKNTAKVIKEVNADVACIVEAENRPTLKSFDTHLLKNRYEYEMLIDGNDRRGIDVGLYSKFPVSGVWTHMFDKANNKIIFSRDCLEVEVDLPNGKPLYVLCNHFKSRGYGATSKSNAKRREQSKQVAKILRGYNLTRDWVIVAGDLNDNPKSTPLKPLLEVKNMYDVLQWKYPGDPIKRWTYYFNKFEQIDFIIVSRPLVKRLRDAGVKRCGLYNLQKLTKSSKGKVDVEKEYTTVTHWSNAASDHGAVWAKFAF